MFLAKNSNCNPFLSQLFNWLTFVPASISNETTLINGIFVYSRYLIRGFLKNISRQLRSTPDSISNFKVSKVVDKFSTALMRTLQVELPVVQNLFLIYYGMFDLSSPTP
jgi:hypothetical protein